MGSKKKNKKRAKDTVVFYTVREAAKLLRVDASTLYRAIRDDVFPAVRIQSRYIVPSQAITQLIDEAIATESCVDVAKIAAERRTAREVARLNQQQV